ncbi:MAG: hypothetical protein ORO03_00860, partial [Alphaproteobacteria bacterium]|nr:hypothetical protein [Alphaproteobacteria bacterium]
GAAAINLGTMTGGKTNFAALFNSIHPVNSVVFQLLQKTQLRLRTSGAITVENFALETDLNLSKMFYKLDGGSIALNGTTNKFNSLSLKATGTITQAANNRLDLVVGSRLDIDHDNNPGAGGTATNLSLEIGAINSAGAATIAADEGVIIGNISSYGTVGLRFVGGTVAAVGAVAAHSSAVTTIMGTVSSKASILLTSAASGNGSVNKIIFDSGKDARVGGQLYLNIVDGVTRGTDITIDSDKVQLNTRVFSSGRLTLKTHNYNNVAGDSVLTGESFVWKTTDSDLILPKKNSAVATDWLANYTVTIDTGDKTVANTPWNLVFDTGTGKTRFFKTWSTGSGAKEVIVTATDFTNNAATIAAQYSVAVTAVKQLSEYHTGGGGFAEAFSTDANEIAWFSSTPLHYNNNQAAVIFHNLGDVGAASMTDLVDFSSVRIVGALTKSGDIGFNLTNGAFTQDSGSVITANRLSITATGFINLAGGTNLITGFGVISAGSAVGQADGIAVSITNGKAIDLTENLIGNGGSVVLKNTVGGISQASGKTISTNLLSLDTMGAVSLASSNSLSSLKLISVGGNVTVTNGKALNLMGGVNAGSNALSLTTTVGGISQDTDSVITAGSLTLSSAGVVSLGGNNLVTGLTVTGGGNVSFKNAKVLNLLGVIGVGTHNLSLITTGGGLTQDASSVVTAGTLSVNSAGVVTLGGTNQVTNFTLVDAGGAVEFKNGKLLNLLDGVNAGANSLKLTTTVGAITQSNSMNNADSISAGNLTLSSAAGVTLNSNNGIASLTITSAGGDIALTNRSALTLMGLVNAGASSLTLRVIAGPVTQDASSVITAGSLALTTGGVVTFGNANLVDSLTISNGTSNANVSFTNGKALELKGAVTVGTGALTLKTTVEAMTQTAAGVVTAGTLSLESAGAITLGQTNLVASLTVVAAGGNVTLSNDRVLNLKGRVNAGAANELSLTTTVGGITQEADSVITANRASFTSAVGISLNGGNRITTLSKLSGAGDLALTNTQALDLNTNLVSGGGSNTITLRVTSGNLKLVKDGMSSDGNLTLTLTEKYDSNGKTWSLGSKTLSGSIGGFTAAVGTKVFTNLAVGGLSNNLQGNASSDRVFDKTGTKTIVFSSVFAKYGRYNNGTNKRFTDYEESLKSTLGLDSIELHDIADLSARSAPGLGVVAVDPTVSPPVLTDVQIVESLGMPDEVTAFSLYNATGTVNSSYKVRTVNFYGTTNINRLDLSAGTAHDVTLNFKSGSIVTISGSLNLGTNRGTIQMEGNDSLRVKSINAGAKVTVTNNSGSLMNLSDTVITVTAGGLGVSSQGNGIILNNRANGIVGAVTGTTNSGSLQIAGAETITGLDLGLGSLRILSTTSVTATNLTAGFVSYQVAGKAVISGNFIGISGSAQSSSITSDSTNLFVGDTRSDQSIGINAKSIILAGSIVSSGGGAVSVGNAGGTVEVVRDSEIVSQNGVISLWSAVNSQVNAGLVVNSGYNGTVNLEGNLGTRSLNRSAKTSSSLKWVEVDAAFVNATNITVRTIGAASAQTTPGLAGYLRPGEVIWNVGTTNGTVSFETTGGGLTQFSGAKSVRTPTGGLKLN